jgi:hypothetical protein
MAAPVDTPASPVADLGGFLVGVAIYKKTADEVEQWAGVVSFGSTVVADVVGGYTYPDFDTPSGVPEMVIGQDTTRDAVLSGIGYLWPEAFGDFMLNSYQTLRSWQSCSYEPTWELRLMWDGDLYIRRYDNDSD